MSSFSKIALVAASGLASGCLMGAFELLSRRYCANFFTDNCEWMAVISITLSVAAFLFAKRNG